jgi:hypothetical protein
VLTRRAAQEEAVDLNRKWPDVVDESRREKLRACTAMWSPATLQRLVRNFAPVGDPKNMCRTVDGRFEAARS